MCPEVNIMGIFRVPNPINEPILDYAPGSPEHTELLKELKELKENPIEIPIVIDGEEIKTNKKVDIFSPHDLSLKLGFYYQGSEGEVKKAEARKAISKSTKAKKFKVKY